MFATLLGPLPRPPLPEDAAPEALLDAVLEAQREGGLEPLSDGGWGLPALDPVAGWRATQERAGGLLVKAVLDGPFSAGRPMADVRAVILALAAAGCAWVEVHEPAAVGLVDGSDESARFRDLHDALTVDLAAPAVHLSMAIVGGSAVAAGIETILAGAYASLAVDLITGPENWDLVARTPGDLGIVAGAMTTAPSGDESRELLLWAAGYAASTQGRGGARVGLATAGSMAHLPWDVAVRRMARLSEVVALAAATPAERARILDPRAVDIRSAAVGRVESRRRRPRGPG